MFLSSPMEVYSERYLQHNRLSLLPESFWLAGAAMRPEEGQGVSSARFEKCASPLYHEDDARAAARYPRRTVMGCNLSEEQLWSWVDREAP